MMQTITLGPNRSVRLPRSVFKTNEKVVLIANRNMVMIKKLTTSPHLSSLAHRKKTKALSLREISQEVHRHRKNR